MKGDKGLSVTKLNSKFQALNPKQIPNHKFKTKTEYLENDQRCVKMRFSRLTIMVERILKKIFFIGTGSASYKNHQ